MKTRKLNRSAREHWWLWLVAPDGTVWLQQRPAKGVWAGLWTLPLFDSEDALLRVLANIGVHQAAEPQPTVRHALTHFDWTLHPRRVVLGGWPDAARVEAALVGGKWVGGDALREIALPAPLRKLLA